eukprot:6200339-Pleurochrysis_carterae.AAC.1
MPLVGGADLNGTASGDPSDLRFNHPYRASPTGLSCHDCTKVVLGYHHIPDSSHHTLRRLVLSS